MKISGVEKFRGDRDKFPQFCTKFKGLVYSLGPDYIDALKRRSPYENLVYRQAFARAQDMVPVATVLPSLSSSMNLGVVDHKQPMVTPATKKPVAAKLTRSNYLQDPRRQGVGPGHPPQQQS